jgi:hypothetical protein
MARSKLRLDLKPLGNSFDGALAPPRDTAALWWVTESNGPYGPQRWEFASRDALDAHLASRGLSVEQIDELWTSQEVVLDERQAVAAPLWLRASEPQHAS